MRAAKASFPGLRHAMVIAAMALALVACGEPEPPQPQVEAIPEGGVRQEPPPMVEPADAPPPLEEPVE